MLESHSDNFGERQCINIQQSFNSYLLGTDYLPGGSGHSEKEMATHSSILAWEIPWTEGPGRL